MIARYEGSIDQEYFMLVIAPNLFTKQSATSSLVTLSPHLFSSILLYLAYKHAEWTTLAKLTWGTNEFPLQLGCYELYRLKYTEEEYFEIGPVGSYQVIAANRSQFVAAHVQNLQQWPISPANIGDARIANVIVLFLS